MGERKKTEATEKYADSPKLVIKTSAFIGIIGGMGMVFGCLLAFWCYRDYLNGNETASIEISLLFLLLFGSLGLCLVLYSLRMIVVSGEEILFRNIFFRRHFYRLDEVKTVKWSVDGYVFTGENGRLFKIYEYTPACELLLQELERRGVELDIPGRVFALSQVKRLHPCLEQRHFLVYSGNGYFRFGGKLLVEGNHITIHRRFQQERRYSVLDLEKVQILVNKEKNLTARIYHQDGSCVFRASCSTTDWTDRNGIFALLRCLEEYGVLLYGNGINDENVQCMIRNRFVPAGEVDTVLKEEYKRLLPVLNEYEELFAKYGMTLSHGLIDVRQKEEQERSMRLEPVWQDTFESGFFIWVKKDGETVYTKKGKVPLYQNFRVMEKAPTASADRLEKLWEFKSAGAGQFLFVTSVPSAVVKGFLEAFLMQVRRKRGG